MPFPGRRHCDGPSPRMRSPKRARLAMRLLAERTVDQLLAADLRDDDISVLLPDSTKDFAHEKNTKAPEGTTTGVATGGAIGGTLGLLAGIGAAVLGKLADMTSITFVYRVCAFLPAIGLLTALLPNLDRGSLHKN